MPPHYNLGEGTIFNISFLNIRCFEGRLFYCVSMFVNEMLTVISDHCAKNIRSRRGILLSGRRNYI